MKTRIPLTLFLCGFSLLASSQIFVKVTLPQSLEQCQGLPVEISITNEGRTPVRNADIQFFAVGHFRFRANSLTGKSVAPVNTSHPAGPQFRLLELDICETTSFQFWMDHACSVQGHQDAFYATLNWNGLQIRTETLNAQIYSPQVSITNLGLYYDETVKRFKKKYTIINIGQVAMDTFSLFIVGDDKMRILNTNIGQLSPSGDTLHFSKFDFNSYGNFNDYFEPGESLTIIQDIQVNACETEFKINHKLLVPCGLQTCEFSIEENIKLLAIVGNPTLIVAQDTQTYASPCRDGEIQLKLRNESKTGTFDLGNSMYNLVLDLGWALIRNGQFTEPLQDNCLKIISAKVGGKTVPLSTTGFTGYGLDFKRLNMDPDGPGGLEDLDNDGFYDDLLPGDSIELSLIYELDRNCLRFDCDDVVFERRTFRLDAAFNNYCNKPGTYEGYISNHTYYWNRPSVSALRFQSIYVDEEKDTVEFYLQKNLYHFLEDCDTDSTVVRITLPNAAEFVPGSVILVNGLPVAFRKNANVISFSTDTSNFRVKIPLTFHCDPASGSGGVNTDCTFCLGSGGPRFNIRIEADYYCNSCYQRIPLYCGSTPAFPVICDTTVVGTASPGKLVIQDMTFKRLTTGYTDSTKTVRVDPDLDSLKHDFFLPYDTFLLYIPIDILCDASFNNILFKLAIAPRYFYVNGVLDTIKEITWLSDTLKFYDGETNRWSSCVNPMGVEYYSQNTNNFYHYYLREMNMSALFGTCLRGSLSTRDSMVFVIKGVINHFDQYQWVKSTLYSELVYNQDGCNMQVRKSATLNILSGKPSGGSTFLRQEYFSDPNLKRVSPYLSVCGNFRLETSVDAYGIYAEDADPFPNEFRNAYRADRIKIVVPPFFQYQYNQPNYVKIGRTAGAGTLKYDTSFIQPLVWDSSGYTIIEIDRFNDLQDHELVQHQFWFDLEPDCYASASDTIRVFKTFKYHLHLPDSSMHQSLGVENKYAVTTSTAEPLFPEIRKQILKDTLIIWPFNLSSGNNTAAPPQYFTYKNIWMVVENLSGQIRLDSLVEYDSLGVSRIHTPIPLGTQHLVFELDSMYGSRSFKFFTHFNHCLPDSLVIWTGNSCEGYPMDYLQLSGTCKAYQQRKVLYYDPEPSRIRLELTKQPLDSLAEPCDTFEYSVLVFNSGLGHSFNNTLHFSKPSGMTLISAVLEYPKDSFFLLPPPQPGTSADEYFWSITDTYFPQGFPGFYRVDENQFFVHLTFAGDCRLEDGQSLSFYTYSTNVCNEFLRSPAVSSFPFSFSKPGQAPEDLYDLKLGFSADSACGDRFKARVVLYSKDSLLNQTPQKLYFVYAKELRFIPGSFVGGKHVIASQARFYYLDDMESVEVPFDGSVKLGDSVIFELELERSCIEQCKTTDFKLILNAPKKVACAQIAGGSCDQLLQVQEWNFNDVAVSPFLRILDSEVRSQFLPGGDEQVNARYLLANQSPFTGKLDYRIRIYYDQNGNGLLDAGDLFIGQDQVQGDLVPASDSVWIQWNYRVPGLYSCRLIMEIHPDDNPCLCNGDTLLLAPAIIKGESRIHQICFDQSTRIGFDSIPGYRYQWLNADRVDRLNDSYAQYLFPGTLAPGQSVWDTVYLQVEKGVGCVFQDTVFIHLYRLDADVQMLDSIRCHGDHNASIKAQGLGAAASWSYQWRGLQDTSAQISGLGPGTYFVTIRDAFGCEAFDSISIAEPDSLQSDIRITTQFNGFAVSCYGAMDGAVQLNIQGGTPQYRYQWENGSTNNATFGLESGWIKVNVWDKNGCPISDSIFLNQPPPLQIEGGTTPAGCGALHGGNAFILVNGGIGPYQLNWSNGQQRDTLLALPSGSYSVKVLDANNCPIDTILVVDQRPDPSISLNITDSTIDYGSSIRLSAWSNALNPKFKWLPSGSVSCDSCSSVWVSPTEPTQFEVEVTDEFGCQQRAIIAISILIKKDIWAPNVFTPNGDGINDKFTIFGTPSLLEIEKLQIFDRWGELVYEGYDFPPNNPAYGWDGLFKSEPMNPAVFVYLAWGRFADGEIRQIHGDVTLIK